MKPDQQYGPVGSRILFENDLVRVWEISLEPGDHLPLHSHALPYLVVTIAHGMRNEILASKQKNEEYVPLTCHWDDGKRGRKQENEQRIITHDW